jgi:hypothetical protein
MNVCPRAQRLGLGCHAGRRARYKVMAHTKKATRRGWERRLYPWLSLLLPPQVPSSQLADESAFRHWKAQSVRRALESMLAHWAAHPEVYPPLTEEQRAKIALLCYAHAHS